MAQKPIIAGSLVEALSIGWAAYSTIIDVTDLPANAGRLERMMADPPIYLPWIIAGLAAIFLAWSIWPRKEKDPDISSSNSQHFTGNGNNVAARDIHIHSVSSAPKTSGPYDLVAQVKVLEKVLKGLDKDKAKRERNGK